MKKLLFLSLIITLIFTACQKPKDELVKIDVSPTKISDKPVTSSRIYKIICSNKTSKGLSDVVIDDSIQIPIDSIPTLIYIKRKPVLGNIQYIRFKSFWSEDNAQVNIHEILVFSGGINVALNKPVQVSSTQESCYNKSYANDGDSTSRWSSDRDIDSYNNPIYNYNKLSNIDWAHLTIDLTQKYLIDSVVLFLYQAGVKADTIGWKPWKQTFNLSVSKDSIDWTYIGGGIKTNNFVSK